MLQLHSSASMCIVTDRGRVNFGAEINSAELGG
jgi:hypothetical protein